MPSVVIFNTNTTVDRINRINHNAYIFKPLVSARVTSTHTLFASHSFRFSLLYFSLLRIAPGNNLITFFDIYHLMQTIFFVDTLPISYDECFSTIHVVHIVQVIFLFSNLFLQFTGGIFEFTSPLCLQSVFFMSLRFRLIDKICSALINLRNRWFFYLHVMIFH